VPQPAIGIKQCIADARVRLPRILAHHGLGLKGNAQTGEADATCPSKISPDTSPLTCAAADFQFALVAIAIPSRSWICRPK